MATPPPQQRLAPPKGTHTATEAYHVARQSRETKAKQCREDFFTFVDKAVMRAAYAAEMGVKFVWHDLGHALVVHGYGRFDGGSFGALSDYAMLRDLMFEYAESNGYTLHITTDTATIGAAIILLKLSWERSEEPDDDGGGDGDDGDEVLGE